MNLADLPKTIRSGRPIPNRAARGARRPPDTFLYGWSASCALCTSDSQTVLWLEHSVAELFHCVPGLGGVICITQSEHTTHCYSHFGWRYHPEQVPSMTAETMAGVLEAELRNLNEAVDLLERDPRLGFYEEDQKYYVTPKIEWKARDVTELQARLLPRGVQEADSHPDREAPQKLEKFCGKLQAR